MKAIGFSLLLGVVALTLWMFYEGENVSTFQSSENVVFPQRGASNYFNDSKIEGVDQYGVWELERAREATGIDFCMVLRKQLPAGYSTESYANALFSAWQVGRQQEGRGVLFVIIEDRKEIKIEVGYALEGIYPDIFCASFQQSVQMYMAGEYHGDVFGMMITSMMKKALGEQVDLPVGKIRRGGMSQLYLSGGAGVTTRDFYKNIRQRVDETMQYDEALLEMKYPPSKSAAESAQNFLSALRDGVDYPFLPVVTRGSQMMRLEYPHPPHLLRQFWSRYKRALPMHVMEEGDLAVARFQGEGAIPLLLRRSKAGLWYVDTVKTWAYVGSLPDESKVWILYKDSPWMFAFRDVSWTKSKFIRPALRDVEEDPYEVIAALEKQITSEPNNAELYFKLGEYLYYECYWIRAAIEVVERGLELDPRATNFRFMVLRMRLKFPMWEGMEEHCEMLVKYDSKNKKAWDEYIWCAGFVSENKNLVKDVRKRSPFHE